VISRSIQETAGNNANRWRLRRFNIAKRTLTTRPIDATGLNIDAASLDGGGWG
jgi:hypothetical protein